ncbi:hypothetical protein [Salinivibrio sp. ML290]|uniref:hypothetical protein n=2 Tax=unclassified Salinivibrio TaxID=2636825 RepID=UPI0010564234|nr:hypothetical protein [Salinivibrio sp. ML290]
MKLLKYLIITACILPFLSRAETLEEGIEILNQGQFKKAREIFKPLAEHGDANAAYWLAYTQFKTAETLYVGSNLLKAAEGGNPWAMATLAGTHMPKVTTSYCNYLGWPCDEKWVDKAIEGWEKLAEEGDGKAMYALLYHDPSWWQYIPFYRDYRYEQLASKLYKNKGYTFFFDDRIWSDLNEDARLKYLEKIDKDGNLYGAYQAAFIYKKRNRIDEALKWIEYGIERGDYYAFVFKSVIFIPLMRDNGVGDKDSLSSKASFFYCMVANSMNSHYDCDLIRYFDEEYNEKIDKLKYFDNYSGERVKKEEIESIRLKARERAKGYKANLYLDETTVEFFRGYSTNL